MNNLPKKPETETKVAVKVKKIFDKTASTLSDDFFGRILLTDWAFSLRFTKHRMEKRSGRLVGEHLQPSEPSAQTH